MATVAAMLLAVGAQPASAVLTDPTECFAATTGSLSLSRTSFVAGQSAALSMSLTKPAGCSSLVTQLSFIDGATGLDIPMVAGNATVTPLDNGIYELAVRNAGDVHIVAQQAVSVSLPAVNGHPLAAITSGDQAPLFALGATTQGAVVDIRGDVNLDLSGFDGIHLAQGVQIIGERDGLYPLGPRVFTTTFPRRLLVIGYDYSEGTPPNVSDVRISGIRFDGQESDDFCQYAGVSDDSDAITVFSSTHVEIDHNELYHWRGAAVNVQDKAGRVNRSNAKDPAVRDWVHDNYIHDNQHPTYCGWDPLGSGHGAGYGVVSAVGGFPLIENNVFSDNRHSITASAWSNLDANNDCVGCDGTGYFLYGNLFLHPGVDDVKLGFASYNHQIDVHGADTCKNIWLLRFESYDCGLAGEYYEVAGNTVISDDSDAIQLRGIPTSYNEFDHSGGMQVYANVFAQSPGSALTVSDGGRGLVDAGSNLYDQHMEGMLPQNAPNLAGTCDFDGDTTKDAFAATGAAMYYFSSRLYRWIYLVTSSTTQVTQKDLNGDGLCDISYASGVPLFYNPGLPNVYAAQQVPVPNLVATASATAAATLTSDGLVVGSVTQASSTAPAGTIIAQSPASGNLPIGWPVSITVAKGTVTVPNVTLMGEASAKATLSGSGLTGVTASRPTNSEPAGTVLAQSIAAGQEVAPGTQVQLTVSNGPGSGGGGSCFITCGS